ncbi:zinc finger BED domain-containing protein 1-like, partial [Temnothorax curvispinosus]|uniref:Zinc finger BED domain-containing protein 1-like n=1 Tax=Temnothorax curvispinosus TaxID=300111 RepID=A0A6J1PJ45_9HYME
MLRVTLCNELLDGRATAVNIAETVQSVIREWNLRDKVIAVVHDSASRSITTHFHKSNVASKALCQRQTQLQQNSEQLVQSCETRWNSKLEICESLLRNRQAISLVLTDSEITTKALAQKLEITSKEWSQMKEMVTILKPFQVATTIFCSKEIPTLSSVRPIINSIITKHMLILPSDSQNVRQFKITACSSLKSRFEFEVDFVNDVDEGPKPISAAQISSFLDPRYKSLDVEIMRRDIIEHVKSLIHDDEPMDVDSNEMIKETALDFLF